MHILICHLY